MTLKKKPGGVPDANQKTPPAVLDKLHRSQNSAPSTRVKKKLGILEETSPSKVLTLAQPANLSASLALVDEATKLLDVSGRIAERLNTLEMVDHQVNVTTTVLSKSSRQRAAKLLERMMKFRRIYNAAWMVRHYQHASGQPLKKAVSDFCAALALELESAKDQEALIYAVAHSLTISPYGVPWES